MSITVTLLVLCTGTLGTVLLCVFVLNKTRHKGISLIKARLSKDLGKEIVFAPGDSHFPSFHSLINRRQLHPGHQVHPRGNSQVGHKEAVKGSINIAGLKLSSSCGATGSLPFDKLMSLIACPLLSLCPFVSLQKLENSQVKCPLLR